ncbi:MAG: sulfurtransferase-like selenium metabolism protein YedF [Clostridiales bacterium]|nr:sulfurtransferase-like selenium metabolism protein YedF [Clostridiales bacterium]
MDHKIDIRGMTANQSWPLIQKTINEMGFSSITTVTDSLEKAREIQSMAEDNKMNSFLEESSGEYLIHFSQTVLQDGEKYSLPNVSVVVISGCTLGRGEQELGKALMKSYFYHLRQCKPYPKSIIFINGGVALTVEDSELLKDLRTLAEKGVEILSSDTCLKFYGLNSSLAVGRAASMKEIVRRMNSGENTIVL